MDLWTCNNRRCHYVAPTCKEVADHITKLRAGGKAVHSTKAKRVAYVPVRQRGNAPPRLVAIGYLEEVNVPLDNQPDSEV